MSIKDFREAFRNGELDQLFTEVVMYYNVEDDSYYVYKKGEDDEHYYADAKNRDMALEIFESACEDLEKAREVS